MKKLIYCIMICLFAMSAIAQDINLPAPQTTGGMPLMDALNARKTDRSYSSKPLSEQMLSNLLWAASGVNRPDGRMTAPTARNSQQIDIYVYTDKNVYLYLPKENKLQHKVQGDYRQDVAMQSFAFEAPVILVYVVNYDKMTAYDEAGKTFYGATDCGNVAQNVYLFCAANGLSTVELGSIHRDKIKELLKFNGRAQLGQPVAFPKE
ncbi:MAG: SagB/ThcOx family dehydrogenase [Bacteroidales bacterium]|nr:SagB/ThcOx family dehydrogenase [Bacteroidales bacterium]